mgnify:CR=1 FL=1
MKSDAVLEIGMESLPARFLPGALRDLEELTRLLVAGIQRIGPGFSLDRDDFEQ